MSLPRDFMGATTPWVSEPETSGDTFPALDRVTADVDGHAANIRSTFAQMRDRAEGMALEAEKHIEAAAAFSADVSRVRYRAPSRRRPRLYDIAADLGRVPTVGGVTDPGMATFAQRLSEGQFTMGSAAPPTIGDMPELPPAPTFSAAQGAPTAPNTAGVDIRPAPELELSVGVIPDVPGLGSPPDLSFALTDLTGELMPPALPTLDATEIDAALERLTALAGRTVEIPRYDQTFPEVFEVVGALLSGELVIDAESIIGAAQERNARATAEHDRVMGRLWQRRGVTAYSDAVMAQYNAAVGAQNAAQNVAEQTAAMGRWLDDALRQAYKLGAAAHAMMIGIEIELYNAEFRAAVLSAMSTLHMSKAAVMAYNYAVASFNADLDGAAAEFARVEALAARHKAKAELADARGALNNAVADVFADSERAKGSEARLFAAQVSANEARARAHAARMRARAAEAEALKVDLEQYRADVLRWEAGAERDAALYRQASAKSRMTIAQNQLEVAKLKLQNVGNDVVGVEARAVATQVQARATELRAATTQRAAKYTAVEAHNAAESVKVQGQGTGYSANVALWSAELEAELGLLDGKAAEAQSAARFFVQTMEAKARAETLTQQANNQLAEAYRVAQEAAAKAGATVNSGKMSALRVSASIDASARVGADYDVNLAMSERYANMVSEDDSWSLSFEQAPAPAQG